MKAGLSLRLGQNLAMTPALQQAIRMLQLSTQDLQLELAQALDSNFMLEAEDGGTPEDGDTAAPEDKGPEAADGDGTEHELDGFDDPWDADAEPWGGSGPDADWYDYRQANLTAGTSLQDHLAWQANLCRLDDAARPMLAHLIDAVDDDGYLHDWPQLAEQWPDGDDRAALERALAMLQGFEPAGVGARDVAECLGLQLRQPDLAEAWPAETLALALRIVDEQMELLARRETDRLARVLGVAPEAVAEALRCIRTLSPHPGYAYSAQPEEYIVPDLAARRVNGRWQVQLNEESLPRVRVNPAYAALVRRNERSGDQQSMRRHLQEAKQLVAALRARNDTLLRVARCIVEQQTGFMEHGPEHMCPLVLREVAERLGIHESTVSRATANKHMLTPMGVVELKYFFSSSVRTTKGGTASATAIQARIKRLIQAEPPGKPLSDARLSERLLEDGLEVARRTVAKYREALGIPPAHERRRMTA